MPAHTSGSQDKDLLLTRSEVEKALNLPRSTVKRFIQIGALQPVSLRPQLFHISDVSDMRKLVEKKVHISKIWNRAFLAHLGVKRLEKKLDLLMEMLQIRTATLSTEEPAVRTLYRRIYKAAKSEGVLTAKEVMDWAKTLLAVDETYLVIAGQHLGTNEPWQHLLWFSQRLLSNAPRTLFSTEPGLGAAYSYFEYAHKHLRQVSYFYCRIIQGAKVANQRIPEAQDGQVTDNISMIVSSSIIEQGRAKTSINPRRGGPKANLGSDPRSTH